MLGQNALQIISILIKLIESAIEHMLLNTLFNKLGNKALTWQSCGHNWNATKQGSHNCDNKTRELVMAQLTNRPT